MTKKKSILAFVLAFTFILSAMFMLTACGNDETTSITEISTESGIVANGGQYRFAYADAKGKGSAEETIALTVAEDGTVTGPTEVGDYLLMFQKQIVEKDGTTYWQTMGDYCICTINIYSD